MTFLYKPSNLGREDAEDIEDGEVIERPENETEEAIDESGPSVELVFTCNEPELEMDADELFIRVQEEVVMQLDGKIGREGSGQQLIFTLCSALMHRLTNGNGDETE